MKATTTLMLLTLLLFSFTKCSPQAKLENSLLWKISGNGLAEESYLFGTNHSVHYSFLDTIYQFWPCLNASANICVESDKIEEQFIYLLSAEDIILPKDISYKNLYNSVDFKVVDSFMIAHNFGPLSRMKAKPAFMSMILGVTMSINNVAPEETMESYILNISKEQNKPIIELDDIESLRKTISDFFGFNSPFSEQARKLLELINNESKVKETVARNDSYYRSQNLEKMQLTDQNNKYKYSIIIDYRNKLWMEKIPEILKSGSSFIAVGASHLVGENGLIELLRKEGYTVEPVIQNKN